jgi:hypothetical protein
MQAIIVSSASSPKKFTLKKLFKGVGFAPCSTIFEFSLQTSKK